MTGCSCGSNVVEDLCGESFCTSCGCKVSEDRLVTHGPNVWDKYKGVQVHQHSQVDDKFVNSQLFSNSNQQYLRRQEHLRRRNIRNIVLKLHLPTPDLITDTTYNLLQQHVIAPKKHVMKKHFIAGIYASCKLHNVDTTITRIAEQIGFTGKHILKFCKNFCRKIESAESSAPKTALRMELVDFRDLETNGVIPVDSAGQFYSFYSQLFDIFFETDLRGALCKERGVMFAALVSMLLQFRTGSSLDMSHLGQFKICSDKEIQRYNKIFSGCWSTLVKICHDYMVWVVPAKRQRDRYSEVVVLAQRLDKVLANKHNIIQYLRKKSSAVGSCLGAGPCLGAPSLGASAGQAAVHDVSEGDCIGVPEAEDKIVNEDVFTKCAAVLADYISPESRHNVELFFRRLLELLFYTELQSKLVTAPLTFYFALLYQIVLSCEINVPALSAFHKKGDEKTLRSDTLIRLTFIRIFLVYQGYILPINLQKDKLLSTIHTYYSSICANVAVFRPLLKQVKEDFLFLNSFSSSSSPRSDLSAFSDLSDFSAFKTFGMEGCDAPGFSFISELSNMSSFSTESDTTSNASLDYQRTRAGESDVDCLQNRTSHFIRRLNCTEYTSETCDPALPGTSRNTAP